MDIFEYQRIRDKYDHVDSNKDRSIGRCSAFIHRTKASRANHDVKESSRTRRRLSGR